MVKVTSQHALSVEVFELSHLEPPIHALPEITSDPECSNILFSMVVQWSSMKLVSVQTLVLMSPHIFSRKKVDMKGRHFMVPFDCSFSAFPILVATF
jgi:hypothetical protein